MLNDSSDSNKLPAEPAAVNVESEQGQAQWPWRPFKATCIAIGLFLASQFLALVVVYGSLTAFVKLASKDINFVELWLNSTLAKSLMIGLAELMVVVGVIWLFRRHKLPLRDLGFGRWPRPSDAVLAPIAFAAYYGLLVTLLAISSLFIKGLTDGQQDIGFDNVSGIGQLLLVFAALVVFAPVAEEVLFRGFLFANLRKRWSFKVTALVTSLIFGIAHLPGGTGGWLDPLWTAGVDTFVLSLALCYLREKTGSLWASIFLHMIKNGVAFIFLFVAQKPM